MLELKHWETKFREHISHIDLGNDPAHDLNHFQRVVSAAKKIALRENAKLEVIIPAAWLHDLVNVPKNDPRRTIASRLSAEAALQYLSDLNYPPEHFAEIAHAIEAHSFSAQIQPKTLEARVVQDADRLDALGAIGIARCFSVGGVLQRPFYSPEDPFAKERAPNDKIYTLDHFFVKLFKVGETLQTQTAREEAQSRIKMMKVYLSQLEQEI